MATLPQFQSIFDNLLFQLKKSNKVIEVSSNFGPHKESYDMFAYIWELEDVHNHFKFASVRASKNEEKAENLRKDGNQFYQKKMLNKALEFYNKSIIYSHQYDISKIFKKSASPSDTLKFTSRVSSENFESKNLPFGYANRSAVLFELKKYEACLLDISRAIHYGYPSSLTCKLVERQSKCYIAQGNKKKAKEVLNEGLLSLKKLGLDETKIKNSQESFESLLRRCDSGESINSDIEDSYEKLKHPLLANNCAEGVPSLVEANQEIPSLSGSVSLSYSPKKGRFLIANQDIMPGEVVIKETSFSHITLPQSLHSHCSNCLQRTSTPIPCPFCSNVVFCSEECLSKAMCLFHSTECPLLTLLVALDLGKNSMLAFRLVTQTQLSELKQKIFYYEKTQEDPFHLGFNEESIYSSDDYRTIYHLVTNREQRTISDLFKRAAIAVCLVKLLLITNYFGRSVHNLSEIDTQMLKDITLVGKVLFIHLMNLPCNAHSLTELQVNTAKYHESHVEEVGAGAFGVLSLTNHSCNPSLARSCYGRAVVAKAIQFIPKGSEISDSYGEHYAIRGREERQIYLRQQYYFVCSCEACAQNWPTYNMLSKEINIKCPRCSASIVLGASKCKKCKNLISELPACLPAKEKSNMNALFADIEDAVSKYNAAYERVLKGDITDETFQYIVDVIFWISKYAVLPNQLLFEAQETLKHCFDRKGSYFFY